MEIIEELEPKRRGLYTGSIGWFGFNGDFELNVVIRTAYIQDGIAHIQAGAGLVADSVPEEEYVESLDKAKALWQAKAMAEGNGVIMMLCWMNGEFVRAEDLKISPFDHGFLYGVGFFETFRTYEGSVCCSKNIWTD